METNKPLYSQIIDYLKNKITNGEFLPDQQVPTEIELAEQFKVSRITSKRALGELEKEGFIYRKRGSGSFVMPALENKDSGSNAGGNFHGMNKMVSMILPFEGPRGRLIDYIKGATEFLNSRGYFLSIHTTNEKVEQEKELLTSLPKNGITSIIYYPQIDRNNFEVLNTLCLNNFPIVTIDKYFESLPLSYVVSDNFTGGYIVGSYLTNLGHKRIAYVSGVSIESVTSVRNRYFGYCRALRDNGLQIDSDIVVLDFSKQIIDGNQKQSIQSMIRRLLQQGVTAIQAENDLTAIDILKNCIEMGIRVPNELSIVGFDDTEIAGHIDIPLTTVAQDFCGIGRRAAEIILEKLEKGETRTEKIVLPVKLIERKSSAGK